jgi:hypothetical protein
MNEIKAEQIEKGEGRKERMGEEGGGMQRMQRKEEEREEGEENEG